ncbi:MAG TPA: hypothetical protein VLI90_08495 [Tepidisphaeraceae bacterium]|nr:hypothetical protein [Tepidisphaeraceae bacterium]
MPPITPQGSRTGLLTSLVIFVILFVTATIFAIYFNVQLRSKEQDFEHYKLQYKDVVADTAFSTPEFTSLQALKTDTSNPTYADMSILDIALKQRADLAQAITGTPGDPAAAQKTVTDTLQSVNKKLAPEGVKLPSDHDNLAGAVNLLSDTVASQQKQLQDANNKLKEAQAAQAAAEKKLADVSAAHDKALADARAQGQAALDQLNQQFTSNKGVIDQLQKDSADAAKKAQDAAQAVQTQMAELNNQVKKEADANRALQAKLGNRRVDVTSAAVRQGDGRIVRIPGNGICYINLGQGDQVTPGMTFEVYDQAEGVPPIPQNATGDEQLPVGKASIEITRVGTTSSECRIVRTSPGAVLSEGDVIANLVYDPNNKYNFFVYGNFDLANTGRPNPADGEVIKRLVTQWGGKVVDQVNVDTDFVVLGKEPTLPSYSKEELESPLNADKLAKAQAELEKYHEIMQTARDLHIPILNQNRFLYYIGYYDQAKR